jgi:iron complex outermembrane receptor protein
VNDANTDAAAGHAVAAAFVGYAAQWAGWDLQGFVRVDNLLDKGYVGSVIVNEGNSRFFEPAPGRTWLAGVSASMKF